MLLDSRSQPVDYCVSGNELTIRDDSRGFDIYVYYQRRLF